MLCRYHNFKHLNSDMRTDTTCTRSQLVDSSATSTCDLMKAKLEISIDKCWPPTGSIEAQVDVFGTFAFSTSDMPRGLSPSIQT